MMFHNLVRRAIVPSTQSIQMRLRFRQRIRSASHHLHRSIYWNGIPNPLSNSPTSLVGAGMELVCDLPLKTFFLPTRQCWVLETFIYELLVSKPHLLTYQVVMAKRRHLLRCIPHTPFGSPRFTSARIECYFTFICAGGWKGSPSD